MKEQIKVILLKHMSEQQVEFFIKKIDEEEIERIVRDFAVKNNAGKFDNSQHQHFWLLKALNNVANPNKLKANLRQGADWDSQLNRQRTAWKRVEKHKVYSKVSRYFSQLSASQQSKYRAAGRNHMSYAHEQESFNWNPLIGIGDQGWDEENDRYNQHMDRVELACALLILIKQYNQGNIKISDDINKEKKKRLIEADFLASKLKSVKFNFGRK